FLALGGGGGGILREGRGADGGTGQQGGRDKETHKNSCKNKNRRASRPPGSSRVGHASWRDLGGCDERPPLFCRTCEQGVRLGRNVGGPACSLSRRHLFGAHHPRSPHGP